MTDEPFDFSDFVKSFDMICHANVKFKKYDDGNIYFYEYQFPSTEIQMTVDSAFAFETIKQKHGLMRMTQKGEYWFDRSFETDVTMKDFRADGTNIKATYEGRNIKDLTNYSPLARFLRWVLHR